MRSGTSSSGSAIPDVLFPGKQDKAGRRENETDSEQEQKQENVRFDQWSGQQIYDLWMWSLRDDKNEPPPHKLVPNRYSTSGRWNEQRYETYNKLINDENGD